MKGPIHLHRIEPEFNMRRFYLAELAPTLFGEISLVRRWGRIGTAGQMLLETFDLAEDAEVALGKLFAAKTRKGYCEVGSAKS